MGVGRSSSITNDRFIEVVQEYLAIKEVEKNVGKRNSSLEELFLHHRLFAHRASFDNVASLAFYKANIPG